MTPERLELHSDDPAHAEPDSDAVATAVAAIRAGKVVVIPTETVYGLTSLRAGESKLSELKGRDTSHVFTRHIADATPMGDIDARARRLADRYWPGPLTLVLPDADGDTTGWRLPNHAFARAVIAATDPSGLSMTSVNRTGEPPLPTADAIADAFGDSIDLLVVDDASQVGTASTVVRLVGDEVEVLREGAIPTLDVLTCAARTIVFVCTGNTCRSPLAEVFAQRELASGLDIEADRLLAHGYEIISAGVAAGIGAPASANSATVAKDSGLDLSGHSSQPVTDELLQRADAVFCLGDSHHSAITGYMPAIAPRVHLLDPNGMAIPDPFGGDLEIYRETGTCIESAVRERVAGLLNGSL